MWEKFVIVVEDVGGRRRRKRMKMIVDGKYMMMCGKIGRMCEGRD